MVLSPMTFSEPPLICTVLLRWRASYSIPGLIIYYACTKVFDLHPYDCVIVLITVRLNLKVVIPSVFLARRGPLEFTGFYPFDYTIGSLIVGFENDAKPQ